jgi:hypothetical protein
MMPMFIGRLREADLKVGGMSRRKGRLLRWLKANSISQHGFLLPQANFTFMRKKWSANVTKKSNALDLKRGVFSLEDPKTPLLTQK